MKKIVFILLITTISTTSFAAGKLPPNRKDVHGFGAFATSGIAMSMMFQNFPAAMGTLAVGAASFLTAISIQNNGEYPQLIGTASQVTEPVQKTSSGDDLKKREPEENNAYLDYRALALAKNDAKEFLITGEKTALFDETLTKVYAAAEAYPQLPGAADILAADEVEVAAALCSLVL